MRREFLIAFFSIIQFTDTFAADVRATTIKVNSLIGEAKTARSSATVLRRKIQNDATNVFKNVKELKNTFYSEQKKRVELEKKELYGRVTKTATNRSDPEWITYANDAIATHSPSESELDNFDLKLQTFKIFMGKKIKEFEKVGNNINDYWEQVQAIAEWIDTSEKQLSTAGLRNEELTQLESHLHLLMRQIQSLQFNAEEKTRSDGFSGIKQIRVRYSGGKNYFTSSHSGHSFASIHDHSNNARVCGMGEFIAVMNGIEFRTRHNDYSIRKAVSNDKTINKVEDVEFPDVPPSVLQKTSIDDQVDEMRKWFKAFKDQDYSQRDYRKYFKPVLCYLEGAWTTTENDVEEPFDSSRHHIDAKTWFELQEKIQFTSYTGTKSLLENLAHLPTTIMSFTSEKKPIFAQWNYRILCHPLKDDLPTSFLKPIADPASQKMNGYDQQTFENKRSVRFDIEGINYNEKSSKSSLRYTYLDKLMEKIPGKDNYGAWLKAEGFDSDIVSADPTKNNAQLNGAYYHRAYKLKEKDAMGISNAQRSYNDKLYVALTTQPTIAGASFNDSKGIHFEAKVSYAIPMEIFYLTPLAKWNPYNIEYVDSFKNVMKGSGNEADPYVSSDPRHFFWTPESFFTGKVEGDAADTSQTDGVYMKNAAGETVKTHASGVRINFPEIEGIDGVIRQRYPIMPIHGEGTSIWKRISAFEDSVEFSSEPTTEMKYLTVEVSNPGPDSPQIATAHTHIIELEKSEYDYLMGNRGKLMIYSTSEANTHSHTLEIFANQDGKIQIAKCDGKTMEQEGKTDHVCFDNHPVLLRVN